MGGDTERAPSHDAAAAGGGLGVVGKRSVRQCSALQSRPDSAMRGSAAHGTAWLSRPGVARRTLAGRGAAVPDWVRQAGLAKAWRRRSCSGLAMQAQRGVPRLSSARFDVSERGRLGQAWLVPARPGEAWPGRHGIAWRGRAMLAFARPGRRGLAGEALLGTAMPGTAWSGVAGMAGRRLVFLGSAQQSRQGAARHGVALPGSAQQCGRSGMTVAMTRRTIHNGKPPARSRCWGPVTEPSGCLGYVHECAILISHKASGSASRRFVL